MMVNGKRIERKEKVKLFLILGTYYYANGDVHEGDWKNGVAEGNGKTSIDLIGIIDYANGDKYVGEFSNDVKAGKGKFFYNNGDVYEGDWEDDAKNGKGNDPIKTYRHTSLY